MGKNLSLMKKEYQNKQESPIFGLSLTKLREYHGSFKSVCENFSMDLTEFEEIF